MKGIDGREVLIHDLGNDTKVQQVHRIGNETDVGKDLYEEPGALAYRIEPGQ
jgi:hypothetical protein